MRLPFTDVRPDERSATFGAFLVLFGMMAAHALLETSRDALFLAHLEARQLPLVYLAIALIAVPITTARRGFFPTADRRHTLSAWLVLAALLTASFWFLVGRGGSWILYALYIWSGIFSTLSIVQFWIVTGDAFTVSQAKRVYALIGTGSILGAIAGSIFAQLIAANLDTRAILLVAAGVLLGTAAGPYLLRAREEEAEPGTLPVASESWVEETRRLLAQPYVKRLAWLTLLAAVTLTFADYIFKSVVQSAVMNGGTDGPPMSSDLAADRLGWFFATAYLVFNCLSLVAQLTIVGWMTRNLGVDRVLAFLPALLLASSLWLAIGGGVLAALFLKGFDGTFRHSLHRTATEVLYVPLAGEWRASIKTLVDVLGQRGGQAFASLGILAVDRAQLHMPGVPGDFQIHLAIGVAVLCGAWVAVAGGLKRPYFDLFRQTLERESARVRTNTRDLDLASLETLIAALSRPDEREVVAALELLAEKGRARLVPALIVFHPSPRVVERALEILEADGRIDHLELLDHLLARPEGSVRKAALLHLSAGPKRDAALEKFIADPAPEVRATAIVGLLSNDTPTHPRVPSILDTIVRAGSTDAKQALADAIRHSPRPKFDGVLVRLADGRDPIVCREVAIAMRAAPKPLFLRSLIAMLEWRESREEARITLVAHGAVAFDAITRALRDPSTRLAVRRHLPRTISRFDPQLASSTLLPVLLEDPDGVVRYKVLRAIGRLRTNHPSIRLDGAILERVIDENMRRAFQALDWRVRLDESTEAGAGNPSACAGLLRELLSSKNRNAIERIFRLLQLMHPREDFVRMYRGLESARRRTRDSSRELLQHVVDSPLREAVTALVDEAPDPVRLAAGARWRTPRPSGTSGGIEGVLREILSNGGSALQCFAAIRAAELGLRALEPEIARIDAGDDPLIARSVERALDRLQGITAPFFGEVRVAP